MKQREHEAPDWSMLRGHMERTDVLMSVSACIDISVFVDNVSEPERSVMWLRERRRRLKRNRSWPRRSSITRSSSRNSGRTGKTSTETSSNTKTQPCMKAISRHLWKVIFLVQDPRFEKEAIKMSHGSMFATEFQASSPNMTTQQNRGKSNWKNAAINLCCSRCLQEKVSFPLLQCQQDICPSICVKDPRPGHKPKVQHELFWRPFYSWLWWIQRKCKLSKLKPCFDGPAFYSEWSFHCCREERVVYRKGTFWQHCATYLLYFIGLMNVFITTFGISGGHYGSIILPPYNNTLTWCVTSQWDLH